MIGSCLAFSGKGRVTWTLCSSKWTPYRTLRLPEDKLSHLRQALQCWSKHKFAEGVTSSCSLGHLQHACRVIRPGRSFLRGMIDLLRPPHRPHHYIRLNCQFRADLQRWETFASCWNGIALFPPPLQVQYDVT